MTTSIIMQAPSPTNRNNQHHAHKSAGFLAMVITLGMALLMTPRALGAELIANGGMEFNSGSGTIPTNWSLIINSHGAWNGYAAHGGSWFMHVGSGGQPGGEYQDIATVAGQQYELSFWAMPAFTAGPQRGVVQVGSPGINNTNLTQNNNAEYVNSNFDITGEGTWTRFVFTFTAASSVTRVSFQNSVYATSGDSAVNVDDVSVITANSPSISAQPASLEALTGDSVSFSVTATGNAPLNYQWYHGVTPLGSQTSNTLSFIGVTTNSDGSYFCVITNNFGSITSAVVTLTVDAWGLVRNGGMEFNTGIGTIPTSWNLIVNSYGAYSGLHHSGNWCMHVGNGGAQGGEYQDITTVPGQKYALSFWGRPFSGPGEMGLVQVGTPGPSDTDVSLNNNAEYVNQVFTNSSDWELFTYIFTATNGTTRVSLQNNPIYAASAVNVDDVSVFKFTSVVITNQPVSQSADCTSNVTFNVGAAGTSPYSYQWYFNSSPLSGQTQANLTLTNLNTCQAGSYYAVIHDAAPSTATSVVATLTVTCSGFVQNGGFEVNGGNGTAPTGWLDISNSFGVFAFWGAAHSGAYVMHAGNFSGDGGMFQDIATVPGNQYKFSVYAVGWPFYANSQEARIQIGTPGSYDNDLTLNNNHEYVDATATIPQYVNASSWTLFSYLFSATTSVTRISLMNVATINGSASSFDDALLEPALKLAPVHMGGGGYKLAMPGTPGRVYHIESTTALPGSFAPVGTVICPPSGVIEYTNAAPPAGNVFYRAETGTCP